MNRIILAINGLLIIAVGYLFFKTGGSANSTEENSDTTSEGTTKPIIVEKKNVPVTGKIAYINIDEIKSLING